MASVEDKIKSLEQELEFLKNYESDQFTVCLDNGYVGWLTLDDYQKSVFHGKIGENGAWGGRGQNDHFFRTPHKRHFPAVYYVDGGCENTSSADDIEAYKELLSDQHAKRDGEWVIFPTLEALKNDHRLLDNDRTKFLDARSAWATPYGVSATLRNWDARTAPFIARPQLFTMDQGYEILKTWITESSPTEENGKRDFLELEEGSVVRIVKDGFVKIAMRSPIADGMYLECIHCAAVNGKLEGVPVAGRVNEATVGTDYELLSQEDGGTVIDGVEWVVLHSVEELHKFLEGESRIVVDNEGDPQEGECVDDFLLSYLPFIARADGEEPNDSQMSLDFYGEVIRAANKK